MASTSLVNGTSAPLGESVRGERCERRGILEKNFSRHIPAAFVYRQLISGSQAEERPQVSLLVALLAEGVADSCNDPKEADGRGVMLNPGSAFQPCSARNWNLTPPTAPREG